MPKKSPAPKGSADASVASGKILKGDGTWPFQARVDGDDIVVEDIVITCFGGWGDGQIDDPQDSGRTASHRNTKDERIEGVAIPMDAGQFPGMEDRDPAGYHALLGSPLPKVPWGTQVEVTIGQKTFMPQDGIVDLGPGKHATKNPDEPHALDLTPRAAALFQPNTPLRTLARTFEERAIQQMIWAAASRLKAGRPVDFVRLAFQMARLYPFAAVRKNIRPSTWGFVFDRAPKNAAWIS